MQASYERQTFFHESVYEVLNNNNIKNKKACLQRLAQANPTSNILYKPENPTVELPSKYHDRTRMDQLELKERANRYFQSTTQGILSGFKNHVRPKHSRSPSPLTILMQTSRQQEIANQSVNFSLSSKNSPLILSPMILSSRQTKMKAGEQHKISQDKSKHLDEMKKTSIAVHYIEKDINKQILLDRVNDDYSYKDPAYDSYFGAKSNESMLMRHERVDSGADIQASSLENITTQQQQYQRKSEKVSQPVSQQQLEQYGQVKNFSFMNSYYNQSSKQAADQIISNYYQNISHVDANAIKSGSFLQDESVINSANIDDSKKNFTHKYNQHKNNKELQRLLDLSYQSIDHPNDEKQIDDLSAKAKLKVEDQSERKNTEYYDSGKFISQNDESSGVKLQESTYRIPPLFKQQKDLVKNNNLQQNQHHAKNNEVPIDSLMSITNSSATPYAQQTDLQIIIDSKKSPNFQEFVDQGMLCVEGTQTFFQSPEAYSQSQFLKKQRVERHRNNCIHSSLSLAKRNSPQIDPHAETQTDLDKKVPTESRLPRSVMQSYRKPTYQNVASRDNSTEIENKTFHHDLEEIPQKVKEIKKQKLPVGYYKQLAKIKDSKQSLGEDVPMSPFGQKLNFENQVLLNDWMSQGPLKYRMQTHIQARNDIIKPEVRILRSDTTNTDYQLPPATTQSYTASIGTSKVSAAGTYYSKQPDRSKISISNSSNQGAAIKKKRYQKFNNGLIVQNKETNYSVNKQLSELINKSTQKNKTKSQRRDIQNIIGNGIDIIQFVNKVKINPQESKQALKDQANKKGLQRRKAPTQSVPSKEPKSHLIVVHEDLMQPSFESGVTQS